MKRARVYVDQLLEEWSVDDVLDWDALIDSVMTFDDNNCQWDASVLKLQRMAYRQCLSYVINDDDGADDDGHFSSA